MTRRCLTLVVVITLLAAACGDDSGRPIFPLSTSTTIAAATTTQATTTTSAAASFQYPPDVIEDYLSGCTPEAGDAACQCTIDEFQRRLALDDFLDLVGDDLDAQPVVQEVIEICMSRVDGTTTTVVAGSTTTLPGDGFVPITDIETIIDLTITDLQDWWSTELPAVFGVAYEPVVDFNGYMVSAGDVPSCGGPLGRDEYEGNAFYCGLEDTVRWDVEGLMIPLFQEFGDFTVALVLAHEWGHAVQNRFGFDDFENPTIVSELQADCLAGAWTARIAAEESDLLRLEPGDLEEAMAGFLLIGDQLGTGPGGPNAHGGSFDRLTAFFEGITDGTEQCATYEDVDPQVVFIPLVAGDDPIEGGDLPLADVATDLGGALEVFWAIAYPELTGEEWVPVSGAIPYQPSTGDFPACGGSTLEDVFYEGNAFYCPPDDYVAWDAEALFPGLYTEIGDFAIGLVLANEWARAAQQRAGLALDTTEAQLQVDCLSGVWAAALVPEDNPTAIRLSAGDLEEAIASLLLLSDDPARGGLGAFERFEAFKDGFLDGADACAFP